MNKNTGKRTKMWARRMAAGLLSLVLLGGLLPAVPAARAEGEEAEEEVSWAQEYLDQLVDWGVMRGDIDGNLYPDREITRAEFVTLINRAYGYDQVGPVPFRDIASTDWFYDDISIGYNMGYFSGTSPSTASPYEYLTREQAALVLGRNMMLQPTPGETLGFSDSREFHDWSRDMIQAVAETGVINGYEDGTFGPQRNITRGEMAALMVRVLGTPIQEKGEYSLGDVDGNVTINTSGVTLRDTFITGDLYLTGGIELGDVLLENVTVLGRIVTSGAGESNMGDSSVILRNVTANEMVVDSISNQFVTVRAEGSTNVNETSVRTHSYLEDVTSDGYGLKLIELDGEAGTGLQLAGNIKEVVNLTPNSNLTFAQGVASKVTVDELATNTSITIDNGARVTNINLDVGASVSGAGDVDTMTVSAEGANVSMLPDTITVRPGITANIYGEVMDNVAAAESSADPRLLAGYPAARDVAPTTANLVFSTNKRGTVYWAVTALADGSASEEDVISPPVYGGTILQSGSIAVAASKTEYIAKLTGLTMDGSYYLTAVMVDERGQHSPVKVAAFTTPDNTTPAFTSGYPTLSKIEKDSAWVTVMTNKSCQLYYALLPKGSTAPKAADFKAGALSGNLGYGTRDMIKNTTDTFVVNNTPLEELTSYDLYLWLTDYDGAKSSAVKKVSLTTADGTNPVIQYMLQSDAKETAATMSYALDEQGTLYWAIFKSGTIPFSYQTDEGQKDGLASMEAKNYVATGMGALKKGSSSVSAAKAFADISYAISSLNAKTTGTSAYDLYYVAKDKAGNWSDEVTKMTIYTLDTSAPTVSLRFTSFNAGDTEDTKTPLADTDIRLVFNKAVKARDRDTDTYEYVYAEFLTLYLESRSASTPEDQEAARKKLNTALREHIKLYEVPATGGIARDVVGDRSSDSWSPGDDWVIDYSKATVTMEDTSMVITFPNNSKKELSALNLANGAEYYFTLSDIVDTTTSMNALGNQTLDFKTLDAQINISSPGIFTLVDKDGKNIEVDFSFQLDPRSTQSSPDGIFYDLMIWSDTSLTFELYRRNNSAGEAHAVDENGNDTGWTVWEKVTGMVDGEENGSFEYIVDESKNQMAYRTEAYVEGGRSTPAYKALNALDEAVSYQYAVHVTKIGDTGADRESWNKVVTFTVTVASGQQANLRNVTSANSEEAWERLTGSASSGIASIGNPDPFFRTVTFADAKPPVASGIYPTFTPYDTIADMTFMLDRPGTIYYVVTPVSVSYSGGAGIENITAITDNPVPANNNNLLPINVPTSGSDESVTEKVPNPDYDPTDPGSEETIDQVVNPVYIELPNRDGIISQRITDDRVRQGNVTNDGISTSTVRLTDLQPNMIYYVYLMYQGNETSEKAACYRFTTTELVRPVLEMNINNTDNSKVDVTVDRTAEVYARLLYSGNIGTPLNQPFYNYIDAEKAAKATSKPWLTLNDDDDEVANPNYTVLQAMIDSTNGKGTCSVFDAYANDDVRTKVADGIRYGTLEGIVAQPSPNPRTIVMDDTDSMSFNLPDQDATYVCVGVAKSVQGGEDSFRAASPVRVVDNIAPKLITVSPMLQYDEKTKTMTGYITLGFDKPLYRKIGTVQYPLANDANNGLYSTVSSNDGLKYCGLGGTGWYERHLWVCVQGRYYEDAETQAKFGDPLAMNGSELSNPQRTSSITFYVHDMPIAVASLDVPSDVVYNKDGVACGGYSVPLTYNANNGSFSYKIISK